MILLHIKIGNLRIRVWFGVVANQAVNLFLATSFIEMYIWGLFPAEHKLVSWHSQPLDIIVSNAKTADIAGLANHISSQLCSAPVTDEIYHRIVVAKTVRLASQAHKPVLVKSTDLGRRVIELIGNNTVCEPLHLAKVMADVTLNSPFHSLLKILSDKPVHIPKRMIVAHVTDSSAHIIVTKAALLEADPESKDTVRYKPLMYRDIQMTCHKNVEARDDPNLKLYWKKEV